jgi:hypothetical protein
MKQILDCLEVFGSSAHGTSSEKGHPRQLLKPQALVDQDTPGKADDSEPMNKWHRMLSQSERDAIIAVFKFIDNSETNSLATNRIREVMRILRLDTAGTHPSFLVPKLTRAILLLRFPDAAVHFQPTRSIPFSGVTWPATPLPFSAPIPIPYPLPCAARAVADHPTGFHPLPYSSTRAAA